MVAATKTGSMETAPHADPGTRPSGAQVGRLGPERVLEVQRARLLSGAVRAVDEFGYARTTVTEITARAHVSRRTFYELFANSEECLAAMLDETVERARARLAETSLRGLSWRERVREGLWSILCFLDSEPALARVCVMQSAGGGRRILERREQLLGELAAVIDEGRAEGDPRTDCPSLTAEGLVGAALSIVHARLLRGERAPLADLHGELMTMIVLPYLGPAAARRERRRTTPTSSPVETPAGDGGGSSRGIDARSCEDHDDPLRDIPIRLTYRTVCVLEVVAEHPGLSNRGVGERSGITDQGQVSKLLSRLERYGLLENKGKGGHVKGEPNAWTLTGTGARVAQSVLVHTPDRRDAA